MGEYEQTGVPPAGYVQPYRAGFAMVMVLFALLSPDTEPLTVTSRIAAAAGSTQRHRMRMVRGMMCFMVVPSVIIRQWQGKINSALEWVREMCMYRAIRKGRITCRVFQWI
jgi:hypothetical protein